MLTYNLDERGDASMYEHLYRRIKNDIACGKLSANAKLPSRRALAKNLGVSHITVENAYLQLLVEGYVYSRPKSGYFVAPLPHRPAPAAPPAAAAPAAAAPDYFVDFAQSGVAAETFPYNIWAKLLRHTLTAVDEHALLTGFSAGGVLPLRRAIAASLYQFRGITAEPRQIITGAGTQVLYNLIVQLLGRSRVYALEDPGYPRLAQIYRANDVSCRFLPLDAGGIIPAALAASGADIAHVTPSHQFPTGAVMPASRRNELLHWAAQKDGRYIIEDDYDCEFRLSGRPIPPLQSIDAAGKVIYINTFSKTLAPTFRISYMVLPPLLADAFYQKLGFYSCTVSNFEQFTLAKFIQDGHLERHINRMRTYYRNKRDKILAHLARSPLASAVRIEGQDSGLHFLLHCACRASDDELLAALHRKKINASFLSQYSQQQPARASHTLLVNYAGIPEERLLPAFDLLLEALAPYVRKKIPPG